MLFCAKQRVIISANVKFCVADVSKADNLKFEYNISGNSETEKQATVLLTNF
jgi:hypothetical protein